MVISAKEDVERWTEIVEESIDDYIRMRDEWLEKYNEEEFLVSPYYDP
jgi:hypothetical protein